MPRVDLPPQTRDLRIDYTALSFVAPEKMRFRYGSKATTATGRMRAIAARPSIPICRRAPTASA